MENINDFDRVSSQQQAVQNEARSGGTHTHTGLFASFARK
jgi:hypothetical protein